MAHRSFKEDSRQPWGYDGDKRTSTLEEVNTGCLQRIADATEVMAKNYLQMQSDLNYYKKRSEDLQKRVESRDNTIKSLKGHITRLKKQVQSTTQNPQ